MNDLPIVAIIGRANVGKSSLFNRMLEEPRAVTAREAGTTRDSVAEVVTYGDHSFWLVDTAGLKDASDLFEATIQQQVQEAVNEADVIIVVVDHTVMATEGDRRAAKTALKSRKPVILALNKIDKASEIPVQEFERLGVKPIVGLSAAKGRGVEGLFDELLGRLPPKRYRQPEAVVRLALIGRPNVGKSSLFNTLAKKQVGIVSARAGTTRDMNRIRLRHYQTDLELLDTAGIRRAGKIEVGIEKFSVLRTMHAIASSDVSLLLLDSSEPTTRLDQKIAGLVKEAGKGLVLVISKWDTIEKDDHTQAALLRRLKREYDFVPWAPVVLTSSETGQNATKLLDLALEIDQNRRKTVPTPELNRWLQRAVQRHYPASHRGEQPKLKYVTQVGSRPPQFRIFGAHAGALHWSYKRFLERALRESFGFGGTPVALEFTSQEPRKKPPSTQ